MSFKLPSDFGGLFVSRVLVTGANGAGKTWFANQLGLPVIHNDALALTRGWRKRAADEVRRARDAAARSDTWVIEGGPSILFGLALARAQAIVWIDLPRTVRLRQIIWRSLCYAGRNRPEHPPGNRDWPGLRQTRFAMRAWSDADRFDAAISDAAQTAACPVIRLTSRRAMARCLSDQS